ncbi:unnamed protein product [Caenorhabditis nigoni]
MISLILLFTATVSGSIENSCTPVEGPKALKCYHKLVDLKDNAVALDLNQYENTQIINNLCKDFKNPCAIPLKCEAEKEVVDAIDNIISYCDAVAFLSIEFMDCDEKLNSRNSTCVQEWNPFPEEVEDPVRMAEIQKEACTNFFGKNDCMEAEIKDLCDDNMWEPFKKHYLALNKIVDFCKFD